jgi:plasmid stabilization system protein ParE
MPTANSYIVEWTNVAEKDLEGIVDYIAYDSIAEALKIFYKIKDRSSFLSTMPQRGRIVPELRQQGIFIYREILCTPWRIIYRISESKVYVLAVIDGRRNVEDILLDRLTK